MARTARAGILDFLAQPPDPLPRLVVLFGKEHILADEAIRAVVAAAIPDQSLRDLNVDTLDGGGVEAAGDIASRAAALPFLAPRRLVIVRGAIDVRKEGRDAIAAGCAGVPEHAVIIVDHSGKPARPQGRKPKDEAAAFASAAKGSALLECALDAAGCARYIDGLIPSLGAEVDDDARDWLAATEDVAEIKNALERLGLTTRRIRLADVRDYAVSPLDVKLWDLGDAVNRRDLVTALRLAREFSDSPIGPLTWLAGDAQVLWELASGIRAGDYARATGQNPWRIGKLEAAARRIAPAAAKRNVDLAMKALERSLTGKRDAAQALEEVIVRICDSGG